MNKTQHSYPVTTLVVLVGPLACLMLAQQQLGAYLLVDQRPFLTLGVLLLWSPLFFSVPSLMMQDARDAALPRLRGLASLLRGLILVPYLLRRGSSVRVPMAASLVGLAAAVLFSVGDLFALVSSF